MAEDSGERTRPTHQEVRAAIIDAARRLFGEKGYGGTTTREIARRAGVHETTLFRAFGSKANIFREAIATSFEELTTELFIETSVEDVLDMDIDESSRYFIWRLYDLLHDQRDILLTVLAADAHEGEVSGGVHTIGGIEAHLVRTERLIEEVRARRSDVPRLVDAALIARFTFALVLALVVFGDWLLPGGYQEDRDRLVDQIGAFVVHAHRELSGER